MAGKTTKNFCYGQEKNESVCSCGEHWGTGIWSVERRAAVYQAAADRGYASEDQLAFLRDYTRHHGQPQYHRVEVSFRGNPVRAVFPQGAYPSTEYGKSAKGSW